MDMKLVKKLLVYHVKFIRSLWHENADDALLSLVCKLTAMTVVGADIMVLVLVMMLILHPWLLLWIVLPPAALYALAYAVAHIKIPEHELEDRSKEDDAS